MPFTKNGIKIYDLRVERLNYNGSYLVWHDGEWVDADLFDGEWSIPLDVVPGYKFIEPRFAMNSLPDMSGY